MRGFTVPTVQAGHAIGVDLGGTKILAGVVARDGSVVRRHERTTPQDSQEHVVAELEAAVAELLDESVTAIGFGVPSPIDQARGVVVQCVNVPLEDAAITDEGQVVSDGDVRDGSIKLSAGRKQHRLVRAGE